MEIKNEATEHKVLPWLQDVSIFIQQKLYGIRKMDREGNHGVRPKE